MEYNEYINNLIKINQNFIFISNIVNDNKYYQVIYKDPDTGRNTQFIHFTIKGGDVIDLFTNEVVGDVTYLNLKEFETLCRK